MILREAAEGEPDLVIEGQLAILLKQLIVQFVIEVVGLAPTSHLMSHVSEMLRQTDHLSTLLGTLLYQRLARLEILVDIVGGTELDEANNTSETILFCRERVLIIRNSVQYTRHDT